MGDGPYDNIRNSRNCTVGNNGKTYEMFARCLETSWKIDLNGCEDFVGTCVRHIRHVIGTCFGDVCDLLWKCSGLFTRRGV